MIQELLRTEGTVWHILGWKWEIVFVQADECNRVNLIFKWLKSFRGSCTIWSLFFEFLQFKETINQMINMYRSNRHNWIVYLRVLFQINILSFECFTVNQRQINGDKTVYLILKSVDLVRFVCVTGFIKRIIWCTLLDLLTFGK